MLGMGVPAWYSVAAQSLRHPCQPWYHRGLGGVLSTRWRKRPTPRWMCHGVVGRRSLPRHRSVLWRDTRNSALGSHAFGFARHTNTDSVRHVRQSVGECGTTMPGTMPPTPHNLAQAHATRCAGRRRAPRGPGAHRQQNGTERSGHSRLKPSGSGLTSEGGWIQPPPPPNQESMHVAAGHHTAWAGGDGGDIAPTPQRFWRRRGPPPQPDQAPETWTQAFRIAPLVFYAGALGVR